jgi:hypothetical protein
VVLFLGGGGRSQGLLGVGLRVRWVWLVLGFCRAWSRASGVGEGRSDCVGPRRGITSEAESWRWRVEPLDSGDGCVLLDFPVDRDGIMCDSDIDH